MNYEDMVTFKPTRPTGRITLAQSAFPPSVQLRFHHRIASKKICQGGSVRRAHTVSLRIYNGPSQLPPPPQPLILIFNLVRNPPQPLTPPSLPPLLSSPLSPLPSPDLLARVLGHRHHRHSHKRTRKATLTLTDRLTGGSSAERT